jgi:small subunit ribosomal protein S9
VAKETEVSDTVEAAEEREAVEEAPEGAAETESTGPDAQIEELEAPEAVEGPETVAEVVAEERAEEDAAEVGDTAEMPQSEAAEGAEESKVAEGEAVEPAESAEPEGAMASEVAELVEELPLETDMYYYGTGRRKTSTAQVRLYVSKEPEIVVNDKPVDGYFSRTTDLLHLKEPLHVTATEDSFRITVKVRGGGISGQVGAIRHGIARALTKANPELRPTLRKGGFLTRDPRVKERKKPGLKRARKAPQYTKR